MTRSYMCDVQTEEVFINVELKMPIAFNLISTVMRVRARNIEATYGGTLELAERFIRVSRLHLMLKSVHVSSFSIDVNTIHGDMSTR